MTAPGLMLAVPEKRTLAAEIYRDRHFFNSDHFNAVRNLRNSISSAAAPNPADLLIRYYNALSSTSPDDPCGYDESLSFNYADAFRPAVRATRSSIRFEKIAVLFNIGAAYSRSACAVDRTVELGEKEACAQFQRAAGAFRMVRDRVEAVAAERGAGPMTPDLSPETSAMLESLMLAQAQECCFERAVRGGKTGGVRSKVAMQAHLYYAEAHAALLAPTLLNHLDRAWVSHIHLKSAQFLAVACQQDAKELNASGDMGECIARLRFGISAIEEAKRSARGASAAVFSAVDSIERSMKQDLEAAERENRRIHLARVPPPDSLPPLQARSLVSPSPASDVLGVPNHGAGSNPFDD